MRAFRIIEAIRAVANSFASSTSNPQVLMPGEVFPSLKDVTWSDELDDEDQDPQIAFEQVYSALSAFSR